MKENKTKRSYEIDMCSGPLFSKIVLFALPLMVSGVLQLLFNAADIILGPKSLTLRREGIKIIARQGIKKS